MATIRKRTGTNGKTTYQAQIRVKGYPAQSETFSLKKRAEQWARQTEAAIEEGRHFSKTEAKRHTLAEAIDRYTVKVLPHKRDRANQGAQLQWWRDEIGHQLLVDMTPALLTEYKDQLTDQTTQRGTQRSAASVNRHLAVLSHVFSVAVTEWGWMEDNPLRKVSKLREPKGRTRFLADDEREKLLEACRNSLNKSLLPIVVLAISTGARKSEIMNLCWREVDLTDGRATIYNTKNNETKSLPLTGLALDLLRAHGKVRRLDTDLVFPNRNGNNPISISKSWHKALREADIENFRFHDLRHTTASYLAMNGATLAEIAEVLGHKTLDMVKRYAHLSEKHKASVVESMNKKIFG